jgi:hypothetical protein
MSLTKFPFGILATPNVGANVLDMFPGVYNNIYFVDNDKGSDANDGHSPDYAMATIQAAVTAAAALNVTTKSGSTIYIKANYMAAGSTDPVSYAENVIIPAAGGDRMSLIGVSANRTQGGLPQIKKGSGTAALLTIRAPGVTVANLGFNGVKSADGTALLVGILIDDDNSTKTVIGTSIVNCHFKNCAGSSVTNGATGGAITWSANGGGWQALIKGNRFYKNVCDVSLKGTAQTVPQDVVIEDNIFSGPAADVDCNLYLAGGSGINGVIIRNNVFPAFPALAGTNTTNLVLTGCVGHMSGNMFNTAGKTFGAAGNNLVPTTVLMAGNYQSVAAGAGATGEIGRT